MKKGKQIVMLPFFIGFIPAGLFYEPGPYNDSFSGIASEPEGGPIGILSSGAGSSAFFFLNLSNGMV